MKHNTGASGQMVILNAMQHRKIIVTTPTDVLKEYISNGESGIFIENPEKELPLIIKKIEEKSSEYKDMPEKAYEQYEEKFSYKAISNKLLDGFSRL